MLGRMWALILSGRCSAEASIRPCVPVIPFAALQHELHEFVGQPGEDGDGGRGGAQAALDSSTSART